MIRAILFAFTLTFYSMSFASELNIKQVTMIQTLQQIATLFSQHYAPYALKQNVHKWDLQEELKKVKEIVESNPNITKRQFQDALTQFIMSVKDYHVGISYYSSESSSLPLTIWGAEGRYFIVAIDRDIMPEIDFPYEIGTEVLEFDGRPVEQVISELKLNISKGSDLTDQRRSENALTKRYRSRGLHAPKGPISLLIKSKNGEEEAVTTLVELMWSYKKEIYTDDLPIRNKLISDFKTPLTNVQPENFTIGNKESFVPELGKIISKSTDDDIFGWYIYQNKQGKLIGYIRINTYSLSEFENDYNEPYLTFTNRFSKIIVELNKKTEALVIDQVNNPGGSLFYVYSLLSKLSTNAMQVPLHREIISDKNIHEASINVEYILARLQKKEAYLSMDEVDKAKDITHHGFPINRKLYESFNYYFGELIDQADQGNTFTDPLPLYGIVNINSSHSEAYNKPILVLVNELDFSGGDFFPSILQDNKRATIFGAKTSGAGGYIGSFTFPNQFGIESISFTSSVAYRKDNTTIESRGVTPDIKYNLTADDLQNNFGGYKEAVNEAVNILLDSPKQ